MLEPVLELSALPAGRTFAPVSLTLDDALVDAYLAATGIDHPLLHGTGASVPMSLTSMVRYSKTAIAGRWPSGTVQLDQRVRAHRALRRGETVAIEYWVARQEVVEGKPYFELAMRVRDAKGEVIGESSGRSLWGGPVAGGAVAGGAAARPPAGAPSNTTRPAKATAPEVPSAPGPDDIGPLPGAYSMDRLRAFGEVAAARDPIHLEPEFARGTPYGRNIAQGRLVMTLLDQLMLARLGQRWLDRGWMDVRFRRPVFVDQPLQAWALAQRDKPDTWRLVCFNPEGAAVIEGEGGIG